MSLGTTLTSPARVMFATDSPGDQVEIIRNLIDFYIYILIYPSILPICMYAFFSGIFAFTTGLDLWVFRCQQRQTGNLLNILILDNNLCLNKDL